MIDFKDPNLCVSIINIKTNEVMVSGNLVAWKDLPSLLISFDFKYFFTIEENPLYKIKIINQNNKVEFDYIKYKDFIYPYKELEKRNNKNELIFREYSIEELDPEIEPLVYALNDAGYETTGSCCGHNKGIAWIHISFKDFLMMKILVNILEREDFKHNFVLTTCPNITNMSIKEIRLSLQTVKKGKKAYKDILSLSNYIRNKTSYLLRSNNLKL